MTTPAMLQEALAFGKLGRFVFPLHNPIFSEAGICTGCTCEEWKRRQPKYGPDYKCPQPGKCPRVAWSEKSTTDPEQISKWFGKAWGNVDVETGKTVWNVPNIGIDCGKSGLLILDPDTYKENYAGATFQLDENTIKTLTGGDGSHLWYGMPEGKAYGNKAGDLPEGIDVRGYHGYICAPPSMHKSGKRYRFAEGHSPRDLDPLPLPQFLIDILEAAQEGCKAIPATFTVDRPSAPDLSQWRLSKTTLGLIHNGVPKGGRSEANQSVITALLGNGANNDDIKAVFTHFAIGEKYQEEGDHYLAHSIGSARAFLGLIEETQTDVRIQLAELRTWVQSAAFVNLLTEEGLKLPASYQKTFIALVNQALQKGVTRVLIGCRQIAELTNVSHMTAKHHLGILGNGYTVKHKRDETTTHYPGINLLTVTDDPEGKGKWVDLTNVLHTFTLTHYFREKERNTEKEGGCKGTQHFVDSNLSNDVYVPYPRSFAIKRRPGADILPFGLNAAAMFVVAVMLEHGELSRRTIASMTGLSEYTVGSVLRKLAALDQLVVWSGHPYKYDLHPNFDERIEELRPRLPSFGVSTLHAAQGAKGVAAYAALTLGGKTPVAPEERCRLEGLQRKAEAQTDALYMTLEGIGVDPYVPLFPSRFQFTHKKKLDWEYWGKRLWKQLRRMEGTDLQAKARQLARIEVGDDAKEADYMRIRRFYGERVEKARLMAAHQAQPRPYVPVQSVGISLQRIGHRN